MLPVNKQIGVMRGHKFVVITNHILQWGNSKLRQKARRYMARKWLAKQPRQLANGQYAGH